jgi:hypothetical protein
MTARRWCARPNASSRLPDAQCASAFSNAFETVRESSWERSADLFERSLLAQVEAAAALPA